MKINLGKTFSVLFFAVALFGSAQTQSVTPQIKSTSITVPEICKSGVIHKKLLQSDPQYAARILSNENKIQQLINSGERAGGTYIIPVVVHILNLGEAIGTGSNISNAQINSAIANMNTCYSGSGAYPMNVDVQFQLAVRDPNCNPTTGIVRVNASGISDYASNGITSANETTIKAISKWPNSDYYNIWIVSEIDNNGAGAGTQGYAYFPGAGSTYDGAVILHNSFGYDPTNTLGYNLKSYTNRNVTANHELGHAFDLYHTFEGDDANSDGIADQCPANTTCSTDGDKCCDTEAHKRDDGVAGGCGSTGTTCSGQSIVNIVQNIMAYSSDDCQIKFSTEQKTRIRAAISGTRASLLTSPALLAISGSSPVVVKTCSPQTTNLSNGYGMGIYGLTIGSTAYSSSGSVAEGGFRNNWCSNFNLTPNTLYSIRVDNASLNPEKVKVYIDYNNNGNFAEAGEEVYSGNTGDSTHSGSFTTPVSPATGQALWIRVISDFSNYTITGPCYIPTYGQVEDFSGIFSSGCTAPTVATTTPNSRCGTGTVILGATASAGTLNWYAASSGGSSLGTGISFTSPSISITTSYYVDATNAGCTSARTAVAATIKTIPSVATTTPNSRCGTGTVILGATASAGTLNWYAASSGGSSLGTGISFTSPSISITTSYYVDATNAGCTSARTAVAATIKTIPSVATTTPNSRCGTGTVILGASASAGTLNWYAASSGGSSLGTGISFTSPSISATTSYYVDATNAGCTSARSAVVATINATPTIATTTPNSRCGTGTVILGATASAGTLNWYAASSGGSSLGTGISFTSPSINATTSYYVGATNAGCTSARSAVVATINATPTIATTTPNSRCGTGTVILGATASAGTLNWYAASSGGSSLGTGISYTSPSISTTTSYYVDATNAGCTSARSPVVATVNCTVPPTQVAPSQCGLAVPDLSDNFYCNSVTSAQDYEWEFVNSGLAYSFTKTRGTGYTAMPRTWITGLQFGVTYNVRVRAKVDGVWGGFGTTCTIAISGAIPGTQVAPSQCGLSVPDLSDNFYCNTVTGAQDYEWEFVNSGLAYSFTKTRGTGYTAMPRIWITGLQFGVTYNVRVRAKVGGVWGSFGTTCTIAITGAIPGTQVAPSQCGLSVPDLSDNFYCNTVTGAQDYEWEFVNSGLAYSFTKTRGTGYIAMPRIWITGLQFGVTYNVRVRAKVGGVWGSFGTTCAITISGAIPGTQVAPSQCGLSVPDLSGNFYCNAVTGAQDYEWEFVNSGLAYSFTKTRGTGYTAMPRIWITGLQFGVTYNVRVRAKVGGVWGSFGTTCTIAISGSVPGTQVAPSQCGLSVPDLSGYFYCNEVTGAQDYEWEFVNSGLAYTFTKTRAIGYTAMPKIWISGLLNGNTYDVRVRTKIGGVWGSFSTVCQITINPALKEYNSNLIDYSGSTEADEPLKIESKLSVYPNPSGNTGFNVSLEGINEGINDISISVYDMTGKRIFEKIISSTEGDQIAKMNTEGKLPGGIYLVSVLVNGQLLQQKVIIQ